MPVLNNQREIKLLGTRVSQTTEKFLCHSTTDDVWSDWLYSFQRRGREQVSRDWKSWSLSSGWLAPFGAGMLDTGRPLSAIHLYWVTKQHIHCMCLLSVKKMSWSRRCSPGKPRCTDLWPLRADPQYWSATLIYYLRLQERWCHLVHISKYEVAITETVNLFRCTTEPLH
jgi:hypothetical protein